MIEKLCAVEKKGYKTSFVNKGKTPQKLSFNLFLTSIRLFIFILSYRDISTNLWARRKEIDIKFFL
jgi:hypothetical protein